MFPVQADGRNLDGRGLFHCQDPDLRSKILPLFSFDPRATEQRPVGHGTAFRIDPWARCATAFHVVEELFEPSSNRDALVLRDEVRLTALEIDGLIFGRAPIPESAWRPLAASFSIFGIEEVPLSGRRIRNVTELMVLRIQPSHRLVIGTSFLPVDLRRWRPRENEQVMALGYADLDVDHNGDGENQPMQQHLYGSLGRITGIEPADGASGRPWPRIRVEAEWPGGMSGGPVFNGAGHVIGIVSAGIEGQRVGTATFFSGWNMPQQIFGSIDPENPGFFRCIGVFDDSGALVRCGQDRSEIEAVAAENGLSDMGSVSFSPLTGDYVRT